MKYFAILFLFFLGSCYTAKKAEEQIDKAQLKFPELLAKKSAKLYPCKTSKGKSDSTKYKEVIKKIRQIDTAYFYATDTICKLDTILIEKNCTKVLYKYREILKELPAVHDTIKIIDEANTTSLQYQLKQMTLNADDYKGKYIKSLWIAMSLLFAIILLVIALKIRK